MQMLWGAEFEGETRTIDVHIGKIRKKLGLQDVIKTVPRIGYRLEIKSGLGKGTCIGMRFGNLLSSDYTE